MQSWALSICAAMVGGGIFYMLVPGGNMKRVMAFTLNLFFVCALVSPFLIHLPKLDFQASVLEISENDNLEKITQRQIVQTAQTNLENGLRVILTQNGYNPDNIIIEINTESQTTEITVILPQGGEADAKSIEQIVQNETGILPKILYRSG